MPACPVSIRRFAAGALVMGALLGAACGGDDEPAATTSTAAPSPSSTTTAPDATTSTTAVTTTAVASEEQAILAAVDGFFAALFTSSAPPDPRHPDLERYLSDEQLERTRALVTERLELGQALRHADPSRYGSEVVVLSISDDTAEARSCTVDDLVLFDRASGTTLNDDVLTHLWAIDLRQEADGWKVADTQSLQQWEGEVECE